MYGWGSHDAKKKAVAYLLETYLNAHQTDQALADQIAGNDVLLESIVTGNPAPEGTPRQMIGKGLCGK